MPESQGIMSLLFGKKKAKVTRKRKSSTTTKGKPVKPKGLTLALRKKARKFKVKTRVMRAGKHVGYRKVSIIKKDIKKKEKKAKAKAGKTTPKRRRTKRSSFGVGGNFMPIGSFMSPYPYAVDSSPPWV